MKPTTPHIGITFTVRDEKEITATYVVMQADGIIKEIGTISRIFNDVPEKLLAIAEIKHMLEGFHEMESITDLTLI